MLESGQVGRVDLVQLCKLADLVLAQVYIRQGERRHLGALYKAAQV